MPQRGLGHLQVAGGGVDPGREGVPQRVRRPPPDPGRREPPRDPSLGVPHREAPATGQEQRAGGAVADEYAQHLGGALG